jgi:hypothetical protein
LQYLYLTVSKLTVNVEEQCLWKLLQFCGFSHVADDMEKVDECSADTQK